MSNSSMKIIDVHIHLDTKEQLALNIVQYSLDSLLEEMQANKVKKGIIIGCEFNPITKESGDARTPMYSENKQHPSLCHIAGIHPKCTDRKSIRETGALIRDGQIIGLKIYLGYFPEKATDPKYFPFYHLAEDAGIPMMFHTGFIASSDLKAYGKEYHEAENICPQTAHPQNVRKILDQYPNLKVILAHLGNPYIEEVVKILNEHPNAYTDLSGLEVGTHGTISRENARYIKEALSSIKDKTRILYGSDWPLVSMERYLKMIKEIIPKEIEDLVFYENAKALFRI